MASRIDPEAYAQELLQLAGEYETHCLAMTINNSHSYAQPAGKRASELRAEALQWLKASRRSSWDRIAED